MKAESELSRAKRELIAQWRRGRPPENSAAARSIPPRPDPRSAPLSFGQQQLWFFGQLQPQSALYNVPITLRLLGHLEVAALENAFNEVIKRHEILRTRFTEEQAPVQIIDPPRSIGLQVIDLRDLPKAQRQAKAQGLLEEEVQHPFDLKTDLMIRARLLRIDVEEWLLAVVMHHIASDNWSWHVLCYELKQFYKASLQEEPAQLEELPAQYADFAAWQQQAFSHDRLEGDLHYWQNKLHGAPTVLNLPFDHSRPAIQTFEGKSAFLELSPALSAQLKELSRREGVTLFMALLAAFQTLLFRLTEQDDLLVGSPTGGRNQVALEKVIGNFVNTVVLRGNLAGDPRFSELLDRTRETVLEALAHRELPFERLVKELRPERSASYLPLVQVMFALQDELALDLQLPHMTVSSIEAETGTAKFDLTMTVIEGNTGLKCWAEYNTGLFEPISIQRMLSHFRQLLESIVAYPSKRISELALITADELEQSTLDWNRTQADFPGEKCVHELFEEQVRKSPNAVAVEFGDEVLTYQQLNSKANQLARVLQNNEVGPGNLVGICLERSIEMMVAPLAIMKTGAAYVPMDPSRAIDRMRIILEDAHVSAVITQKRFAEILPLEGISTICVDTERQKIACESDENLSDVIASENRAYVIYTSGSTGVPKGVQIAHQAVVNFLTSMQKEPGLGEQDVLLSVTSLSFDISALEIFLPLTVGARIVLADANEVLDGVRLASLIEKSKATVMQGTPSTWQLLLESGWNGSKRLKILCGGESLSRSLADQLLERSAEVWNLYGPTETTIWSTLCKVPPGTELVSIGKPIANTQIYVLDSRLNPVPVGVVGELCIGGEGVALGYLNQPQLTAEKFIPNPFDPRQDARLYRTGDRAKFLADGKLVFLGRRDHQVKIRGHRIELGEIETVLGRHPKVRQAVVILQDSGTEQSKLIAWVLPNSGQPATTGELRAFLEEKLPDYAIPSIFVPLKSIPLTASGKIDRKSLPRPTTVQPEVQIIPPETEIEEKLAGIWREVLQLTEVGIHDNFFELGGHSLGITQIISRVRRTLQVEISFAQFFQSPTIAKLAAQIEESARNGVKYPITKAVEKPIVKRRKPIPRVMNA